MKWVKITNGAIIMEVPESQLQTYKQHGWKETK
jgi:hypothetical protein